jgi:hypothetical protein
MKKTFVYAISAQDYEDFLLYKKSKSSVEQTVSDNLLINEPPPPDKPLTAKISAEKNESEDSIGTVYCKKNV